MLILPIGLVLFAANTFAAYVELTGANPFERLHEDGVPAHNPSERGSATQMVGKLEASAPLPPYETGHNRVLASSTASPEEEENAGGEGGGGEGEHQADGGAAKNAREQAEDNQEGDDDATGADRDDEESKESASSESESSESVEEKGESAEGGVHVYVGGNPGSAIPSNLIREVGPLPEPYAALIHGAPVLLVPPKSGPVPSGPFAVFPYSQYRPFGQESMVQFRVQSPPAANQRQMAEITVSETASVTNTQSANPNPEANQAPLSSGPDTLAGQGNNGQPTQAAESPSLDRHSSSSTLTQTSGLNTGAESPMAPAQDGNTAAGSSNTDMALRPSNPSSNPLGEPVEQRPRGLYKRSLDSHGSTTLAEWRAAQEKTRNAASRPIFIQERLRPKRLHGSEKKFQRKLVLNKWFKVSPGHNIQKLF